MSANRASVILLIAIALGAPARADDAPKWDQKQVTDLAAQLVQVMDQALADSQEATQQATALQQRRRDAAVAGYRRVRTAAADYLVKLRAGRDRDLTEGLFRNLKKQFESTRATAGDAVPMPKAQEQLQRADQLLDQIGRYYPDL